RVNHPSDLEFVSNKVIVARSYLRILGESDSSARDSRGHGTSVAMAAAGLVLATENGPISGVAPRAWLGSYNIFGRRSGTTRGDIILKAMDDAVSDEMDVINLSLGSPFAFRPEDSIFSAVIDRATAMGVIVVVAGGNDGPEPFTIGDLGVAPSAITVGATWNDRILSSSVRLADDQVFPSIASDGPNSVAPISAAMRDVAELDPTGLACDSLPEGSLTGQIAFILRGVCFFEEKLDITQAAGAVAAIVYTDAERPDAIIMSVGSATLPASMVSHEDGLVIKDTLTGNPELAATIDFEENPFLVDPNRLALFSGRGPNTDLTVKPDMVATGVSLNTALLGSGFAPTQGTSFSAPLVAGAAAVLQAERPGYSGHHYRSMLINAASPLVLSSGSPERVQNAGGGVLDMDASLAATVTAYPTSVSLGRGTGSVERKLTVSNLNQTEDTFSITVQPFDGGAPPVASTTALTIPPRESRTITLTGTSTGLPAGGYQGMIWIRGSQPGSLIHVPYWYAVTSNEASAIKIVDQIEVGAAGGLIRRGLSVRTTDRAGVPIDIPPSVTVVSGGGTVAG
ncbi:MAG: S8 family serine peptidase, partial [bacterium]|nr:S8 family serine peptidase [bacterium]